MHAPVEKIVAPPGQWPGGAAEAATKIGAMRVPKNLANWAPMAALALLAAGFSLASSQFHTAANLQAILEASAVPLIIAVGITFVILQGSIDLSIEGVTAIAGIGLSLLVANSSSSLEFGWWGVTGVLVGGLLFGLANGALHHLLRMPSLIVTLSTWFIGLGVAALLFPSRQPQVLDQRLLDLSILKIAGISPIVYVSAAVLTVGVVLQGMTRFGRLSYAIGEDERLVRMSGIAVGRHKVAAYAISGFTAALAGVFLTCQSGVGNPTAGQGFLFPAISAAVIGGTLLSGARGGVLQTALGVFILQVLENGMVLVGANPLSQQIVEGATITIAVAIGGYPLIRKLRVVK
jgi:ribose transport system permease protein